MSEPKSLEKTNKVKRGLKYSRYGTDRINQRDMYHIYPTNFSVPILGRRSGCCKVEGIPMRAS
jgi:hypothetical protein